MKSINRVSILGHVVADPQIKSTKSGKSVLSFAIATNNEWLDQEGTLKKSADFHRIVAWEKLAEICAKHLRKGTPVMVEGRLTNRAYEGNDKVMHYVTEVVLNDVHLFKYERDHQSIQSQELAEEAKELVAA
ncbi:MAG: single-stranded DNA-binding protein [Candidatus Gracilibacteria bacterium]